MANSPTILDPSLAKAAAIERAIAAIKPKGLGEELSVEFDRVALFLAAADRLRPHYVDSVLEYCRATLRLRALRASFDSLEAEIHHTEGRNGEQIKLHPHVAQINEAWRQWRSIACAMGLTPADEKSLADSGPGESFEEADKYFAN